MAIIKESSRVSEQVLTINVDFIDVTATSGIICMYLPNELHVCLCSPLGSLGTWGTGTSAYILSIPS